jgi:hypothetical protein
VKPHPGVEAVTRAGESAAEAKAEFLPSLQIGGVDVGGLLARGDETLRDWAAVTDAGDQSAARRSGEGCHSSNRLPSGSVAQANRP